MILHPPLIKRGICIAPWLILIPQRVRHDAAYLAHELCHAEQQRKHGVITFWWMYLTSDAFRFGAEVEAYKVQIAHGANLGHCAWQLFNGYTLPITFEQAQAALTGD